MGPRLSVVIATYNRRGLLERLLAQLGTQSLTASRYEVVVVDDGSAEPVAGWLDPARFPVEVRLVSQPNAGAAAARDHGIREARGPLLVLLDDDMQVPQHFLAAHLAAHPAGSRRAVLGQIRPDPEVSAMPYFERWYASRLDAMAAKLISGTMRLYGSALYTGNLSLRRADYLAVGGFDATLERSEDAELGVRLEQAGVELGFAPDAFSLHGSDHTSEAGWLSRAFRYGVFDSRIGRKHPGLAQADPWRFLFKSNAAARPLLAAAAAAPRGTRPVSRALLLAVRAADRLGLRRLAFSGASVAYSMEYFRGVRHEAGSLPGAVRGLRRHLGLRSGRAGGASHVATAHP